MSTPARTKDTTAKEISQNSRVQMMMVIHGLLAGYSVRQIAAETGIPPNRITRWSTQDSTFAELLGEVEAKLVDAVSAEIVEGVSTTIERLAPKATTVLEDMLDSEKDSVKLAAAKTVLQLGGITRSERPAQVIPIEARIRERAVDVSPATGD